MFSNRFVAIGALMCVLAALFVSSCANQLDLDGAPRSDEAYGALCVSSQDGGRSLDIAAIAFADVTVSGYGFSSEPSAKKNVVAGGKASNITISKVPVGKNRVVSVQAFDSSYVKMGTLTMRAVCDIDSGANSVMVSWSSTALGNVFYSLLNKGYDISKITETEKQTIQAVIDAANVKTPALLDTEAMAADWYDSKSLKAASTYVLDTASLALSSNITDFKVQVCDPVSAVASFSGGSASVSGIAPGTCRVYLIQDDKIVRTVSATFRSGETTDLGAVNVLTDSILLHVYGFTHVWAWDKNDESTNYTGGIWPGVKMEEDALCGDGWCTYTIPASESMIIFSNAGSGQTADLSRTAGEWWYKGAWFAENPADYTSPVLKDFSADKTGTVSGDVKFTIYATDDKELKSAVLYKNGEKLASVSMKGDSCKSYYTWDSTCVKNGTYEFYCVVKDSSGNVTESQTITLATSNENRKPVAVINGFSTVGLGKTVKFNGSASYDPNGTIVSYAWSVSGGAAIVGSSTESTVQVQFPSYATENCVVSLSVTDDDGASDKRQKPVSVTENVSNDFREETIYFVITTRFFDGDSSNNVHCWDENPATPSDDPAWRGDFKGLIQKLDYIKALGFSAVWITPVVENCSGLDYHGYHAMNFQKVDPRYESSDTDFQDLINAVHEKGMKLVLDVVFNHTGNFGEATLAPMFEKDYSADLEDINACLKLSANSLLDESYFSLDGDSQYATRLKMMKNTDWQNHETHNYFHHFGFGNWDNFSVQFFQMAGDCVDLNTENPKVLKYIAESYSKYIEMGVDAFRIDTGKHLSRLEFNCYLNDAFKETASKCGNDGFFMFTEICAKSSDVTYRGNVENLSPYFYTWQDDETYGFTMADEDMYEGVIILPEANDCSNDEKDEQRVLSDETYWTRETVDGGTVTPVNSLAVQKQGMDTTKVRSNQPTSANHLLDGNSYHTPDYSKFSGLNVIDFPMHWNFNSARDAFGVHGSDKLYNDATWNVVYVDSHDYGPSDKFEYRYDKGTDAWAENLDLMFTFRGIPCLYYGSEVEFQAGEAIDKGPNLALKDTGRAYYGDYLEGTVTATDFSIYTATGKVADTLNEPLCKHIRRLNMIRRAIPALQKGQYSTEDCGSSGMAFKRRYTDSKTDSFVLVTISEDTTFSNLPAGTYIDAITGDSKAVSQGGSLTTTGCTAKGNMRVYVLNGPGQIGEDTNWLK